MPKRYLMTWNTRQKRWFKKANGKQYSRSVKQLEDEFPDLVMGESKEGSYRAANEWWLAKESQLKAQDNIDSIAWGTVLRSWVLPLREHARVCRRPELWHMANTTALLIQDNIDAGRPCPSDLYDVGIDDDQPRIEALDIPQKPQRAADVMVAEQEADLVRVNRAIEQALPNRKMITPWHDPSAVPKSDGSLESTITQFSTYQQREFHREEKSAGRVGAIRAHLKHFQTGVAIVDVADIDARVLLEYHEVLKTAVFNGNMSAHYGRDILSTCKRFTRWCWQMGMLDELPKNIDQLRIEVVTTEVETFDLDELRQIYDSAAGRTQLYLLLMMNCGMQQQDIADLRLDQVDWQDGRIVRKRSKTAKHDRVPVVSYKLWPRTLDLLRQHRSQSAEVLIVNGNGEPLKMEGIRDDGRVHKTDNIRSAYYRVTRKLKIERPKPLKLIRKTSASLLANRFGRDVAKLFLGHAPADVADQSYLKPARNALDAALDWLGEEYALHQ